MSCYNLEWYKRLDVACRPDHYLQQEYPSVAALTADIRLALAEIRHMQQAVEAADRRIIQTKNEVRSAMDEMIQACQQASKRWNIVERAL